MSRYILVGKAGSGKDWLQRRLVERGYRPMRQYTTRAKRDNETGDEYHFVTDEEYNKLARTGIFISSNDYRIGWYGVSYLELKVSDVAILSPANMKDLSEKYPKLRKEFTVIYLDMPIELRRSRLSRRYTGKPGDDNEVRIANDEMDFRDFNDWDIRLSSENEVNNFVNNLSEVVRG